jgi:hypothetical protein
LVGYVDWYTAEALFENLVMQSRSVCRYRCFTLRVGKSAEYYGADI